MIPGEVCRHMEHTGQRPLMLIVSELLPSLHEHHSAMANILQQTLGVANHIKLKSQHNLWNDKTVIVK